MFVSTSTFLNALFLLLGDNSDRSRSMVKEFLDVADKDAGKKEIVTADDELITAIKGLIKSVINEKISQENQTAAKILLLKINTDDTFKAHPIVRDLLRDVLTAADPITAEQIDGYLKDIRNALLLAEMDSASRQLFAKSRAISDIRSPEDQEIELFKMKTLLENSLKSLEQRQSTSDTKASESYVSLSDPDSIRRSLQTFMERSVKGIIRSGLQGLNKSLGARGGLGLGETAVWAALSHNYKSGILVSWMIWAIVYNNIVVEPGKKALVYFVSLENEVHQNLMQVFKALYCRIEKRNINPASISTEEVAKWLENYFAQFNTELFIDRYTPHEFSYQKFLKRYNAFVDMGYQMILFDLDYMSEARGIDPGDTFSSQGQIQLIKENYLRFANFAKQQGFLLTTGHQLTKKAAEVAGVHKYAVKRFNDSMMADSSDVFRIIDALFFVHLENNLSGHKFLTMQNRKNRGNDDTPEKDKFFAQPFTEFGIEDDIDGLPQYVTDMDDWQLEGGVRDESIVEGAMF